MSRLEKEMEAFTAHLQQQNLSQNSIYQYTKYLSHYVKAYESLPVGDQEDIYRNIEDLKLTKKKLKVAQTSTKSQTLKAVVAYRKFKGLPNNKLVVMYGDVNREARGAADVKKKELDKSLPPLKEHQEWVNKLYDVEDPEKLRTYIINKLIINENVRNLDLVAEIITKIGQLKKIDPNKNYLYINGNNVLYIRNNYKTSKTYGELKSTINEPKNKIKFVKALRIVLKNSPDKHLVPLSKMNDLSNYIIQQTNGLGETKLMKMALRDKNTLGDATKMGLNRGTALQTLQDNYNIAGEQ